MSADPPVLIAMGPCHVCGGIFGFDPDRVTSVLIDPETGRPPDVDEDGNFVDLETEAEGVARSSRRPVCPRCCKALNAELARRGQGPRFDETDTSDGQVYR